MIARAKTRVRVVPVATQASKPLSRGQKNHGNICQQAVNTFGRYKPEPQQEVRQPVVKPNKALAKLIESWKKFDFNCIAYDVRERAEEPYIKALELIRNLRYSAHEVEQFSIALVQFQKEREFSEKAGIFLSALINNGSETNYVIHTRHLDKKLSCLGVFNKKNLVIEGDVYYGVGKMMLGGSITVNGNVDFRAGFLMFGGKLVINGNTGTETGYGMTSGEIHVNGELDRYKGNPDSYMPTNGRLYHKGQLIIDGPKITDIREAVSRMLFRPKEVLEIIQKDL